MVSAINSHKLPDWSEITMPPIITTKNFVKIYRGGVKAVDDVSFEVEDGEIFGLLGPNGAGKSTLIRMLCTLTRPTSGTATVAGYDVVKEANEVRKHIGLVAEKMIMYDSLTAYENLMLFGKLHDIPKETLNKRIDELLSLVRMSEWRDTQVGIFSSGMRQRINVIRGLLNMPEILFFDEPTLGLDPESTLEVRELTRKLNKEQGITIILTTHYMDEADMLSDRVGIIDYGKIVALDTPAELKKKVLESNAATLELNMSNRTPELMREIESLKCVDELSAKNPIVEIRTKGDDAVNTIIDTVRSNGGKIVSIKTLEPTLEDAFNQVTRHKTRKADVEKTNTRKHWRLRRESRSRAK